MPTYDVLVAAELLPEFTNDNPRLPEGFRIIGEVEGPSGDRNRRMRVEDGNAPAWTEGKLISPAFQSHYDERGAVTHVTITSYDEMDEEAVRISGAVQAAENNPGHTIHVEGGDR